MAAAAASRAGCLPLVVALNCWKTPPPSRSSSPGLPPSSTCRSPASPPAASSPPLPSTSPFSPSSPAPPSVSPPRQAPPLPRLHRSRRRLRPRRRARPPNPLRRCPPRQGGRRHRNGPPPRASPEDPLAIQLPLVIRRGVRLARVDTVVVQGDEEVQGAGARDCREVCLCEVFGHQEPCVQDDRSLLQSSSGDKVGMLSRHRSELLERCSRTEIALSMDKTLLDEKSEQLISLYTKHHLRT